MKTISISQRVAAMNPARGVHAASSSKHAHAAGLISTLSAISRVQAD